MVNLPAARTVFRVQVARSRKRPGGASRRARHQTRRHHWSSADRGGGHRHAGTARSEFKLTKALLAPRSFRAHHRAAANSATSENGPRHARNWDRRPLSRDSKQTLLCTYLSAAVLAGLVLNAALGWWWADPSRAWCWLRSQSRKGATPGAGIAAHHWRRRSPTRPMRAAQTAVARPDCPELCDVAAGGAELQLGAEPDLFFDGRSCYDQSAAHHLVRAGLIDPATLGPGRTPRRRRPHPGRTPGPGRLRPRRVTVRVHLRLSVSRQGRARRQQHHLDSAATRNTCPRRLSLGAVTADVDGAVSDVIHPAIVTTSFLRDPGRQLTDAQNLSSHEHHSRTTHIQCKITKAHSGPRSTLDIAVWRQRT